VKEENKGVGLGKKEGGEREKEEKKGIEMGNAGERYED